MPPIAVVREPTASESAESACCLKDGIRKYATTANAMIIRTISNPKAVH